MKNNHFFQKRQKSIDAKKDKQKTDNTRRNRLENHQGQNTLGREENQQNHKSFQNQQMQAKQQNQENPQNQGNQQDSKAENKSKATRGKKQKASFFATHYAFFKRLFDILIASFLLSMFFLPMCFIWVCVRLSSPGPALFVQWRLGQGRRPFRLYKFRTMRIDTPANCATAELENADSCITPFGAFLRKTSLDELPQLFNILLGDMSLVGPRPVILKETNLIKERLLVGAYTVKPGMTGLAQINGRDTLSNSEKASFDGIYAKNSSFALDVAIVKKTIVQVFMQKDIVEGRKAKEKNSI